MPRIDIHNIGKVGVIQDVPAHQLPPEVWSYLRNMRCVDGNLQKFTGHTEVMFNPGTNPGFIMNVATPTDSVWIYAGTDEVWGYSSASHAEITNTGGLTNDKYENWNGTVIGGIPILNTGVDIPQMWPSLNLSTEMEDLLNWPEDVLARQVKAYGQFLVALNISDNSSLYPHMLWWSSPAEVGDVPVSWDYTNPATQAGRRELTDVDAGVIVDGGMLRNSFIIYKEFSTHIMQFVGGVNVMKTDLLFASSGLLAPKCFTPFNKGEKHLAATIDDIIIHNGQGVPESIIEGKNRRFYQKSLSQIERKKAFAFHNPAKSEVWVCYPETGAETPTIAFVWNYANNTQYFRDFNFKYATNGFVQATVSEQWNELLNTWDASTLTWGAEGQRQAVAAGSNSFQQLDTTQQFNGVNIPFVAQREGIAIIGRDRGGQPKVSFSHRKLVNRLWIKAESTVPFNVEMGAQERRGAPLIWSDPQSFNPNTQMYLDFTVNGRLLAVRFSGEHGAETQIEGFDIELEILGEL